MARSRVTDWTPEQEAKLCKLHSYYKDFRCRWEAIGKEMGISGETCRSHWRLHKDRLMNPDERDFITKI